MRLPQKRIDTDNLDLPATRIVKDKAFPLPITKEGHANRSMEKERKDALKKRKV